MEFLPGNTWEVGEIMSWRGLNKRNIKQSSRIQIRSASLGCSCSKGVGRLLLMPELTKGSGLYKSENTGALGGSVCAVVS